MSAPANLDIVAASSLTYGDITVLAQQSYLSYTLGHPDDNSNKWTVALPAVRDKGFIAWRVRYPLDPRVPPNPFGWSAVQITLCDYATGATVIDYDPMKLLSSPQLASKPLFISSFWWGMSDRTAAVQSLLTQNQNPTSFDFNLSQLGPPPSSNGPMTALFMVYGEYRELVV